MNRYPRSAIATKDQSQRKEDPRRSDFANLFLISLNWIYLNWFSDIRGPGSWSAVDPIKGGNELNIGHQMVFGKFLWLW